MTDKEYLRKLYKYKDEYRDWIEYCLNVMDKARVKIIEEKGVDVESFEYGVAVGLGRAIEIILDVEEEWKWT